MPDSRRSRKTRRIRLPLGRFRPPHCPNQRCRFYRPQPDWRYIRYGRSRSRNRPRRLQRYCCKACGRTFSALTFSPTYWLHRWDLFNTIVELSVAGAGLRQIGRTLEVSHTTVRRHLARAGRHCLLFHRDLLQGKELREPVAFDGFESFEYSQYFPFHLNLAAGRESWFLYHFTCSPLRRKGRMTEAQKVTRRELEEALGRPNPKAVEEGTLELLRVLADLLPKEGSDESSTRSRRRLLLESDEHPAYRRALGRLRKEDPSLEIRHRVTPSTAPRTLSNPLFPCNLADLLLRHCGANHRRETVAFSKRAQGALERAAIFTVWRNCVKWRQENDPGETAAMRAGILNRRLSWRRVFSRRRFPREEMLPASWWSFYWGRVKTLIYRDRQTEHTLRYAF